MPEKLQRLIEHLLVVSDYAEEIGHIAFAQTLREISKNTAFLHHPEDWIILIPKQFFSQSQLDQQKQETITCTTTSTDIFEVMPDYGYF